MSEMEISMFDGVNDAYWWLLCTDKYFTAKGTPETEKLAEAVIALRGCARHWWLWWHHRHQDASWKSFVLAFLWRFKPEDRDILPICDEEEQPEIESESLRDEVPCDQQHGINQGKQLPNEIVEENESEGKGNEGSVEEPKTHKKEEMNVIQESSNKERKTEVLKEEEVEEKINNAQKMKKEFLPLDHHCICPTYNALPGPFPVADIGCHCTDNHYEGGRRGKLVDTRYTIVMLCFVAKNTTQNRVYDPGICFHAPQLDLSIYFKLWDPGGHLWYPSP